MKDLLLKLGANDFWKGLIVAIGGAVVAAIQSSAVAGSISFNWKYIGGVASSAFIAYIGKNLFTPAGVLGSAPVAK